MDRGAHAGFVNLKTLITKGTHVGAHKRDAVGSSSKPPCAYTHTHTRAHTRTRLPVLQMSVAELYKVIQVSQQECFSPIRSGHDRCRASPFQMVEGEGLYYKETLPAASCMISRGGVVNGGAHPWKFQKVLEEGDFVQTGMD